MPAYGVGVRPSRQNPRKLPFSPLAQAKARALAIEMGVNVNFEIADAPDQMGELVAAGSVPFAKDIELSMRVAASQKGTPQDLRTGNPPRGDR